MPIVLILAAVGVFMYVNSAKAFTDQFDYKLTGGSLDLKSTEQSGFTKLYLTINVTLINPTSFSVTVKNMLFDILNQGKKIGTVSVAQQFSIKPNSSSPVKVSATMSTVSIIPSVVALVKDFTDDGKVSLQAVGKIYTSVGTVTLNQTFEVV